MFHYLTFFIFFLQRQPEQEACLKPSEESSQVLPPIHVGTTPTTLSQQEATVVTIHQPPRDVVMQQATSQSQQLQGDILAHQATSLTSQTSHQAQQDVVRQHSGPTTLPHQLQRDVSQQATSPTSQIYQPQRDVVTHKATSSTCHLYQPQREVVPHQATPQMYQQQPDVYRQCSTGLPPSPHQPPREVAMYQTTGVRSPPIQHSFGPAMPFARSPSTESHYHSQASQVGNRSKFNFFSSS